jgi:predicted flap endonuclease-1-like 5' DNA nuclease
MSLLFRVLYAVHARGTHHKLALDAVAGLEVLRTEDWQRVFLKHAEAYMAGAKAPDDVFKDFKNHVLHPRDGYWGGAPAAARAWYGRLVTALAAGAWTDAVYAAGVLGHYVTDVVHPFHTGQSEAESCIHLAFEWSTAKSYDLLKGTVADLPRPRFVIPARPDWLEEMMREAAKSSNRHYEKLIAHYDINRGVVDPPAGLDDVARRIVGELIVSASTLVAVVLARAIEESRAEPPDVSLSLDTLLATLQIPLKTLVNRLADREDRKQVERMYDELRATGSVVATLPADDRAIRELHRAEVLGGTSMPPAVPLADGAPSAAQAPARGASEAAQGSQRPDAASAEAKPAIAAAPRIVASTLRKSLQSAMPLAPLAPSTLARLAQSLPVAVAEAPAVAPAISVAGTRPTSPPAPAAGTASLAEIPGTSAARASDVAPPPAPVPEPAAPDVGSGDPSGPLPTASTPPARERQPAPAPRPAADATSGATDLQSLPGRDAPPRDDKIQSLEPRAARRNATGPRLRLAPGDAVVDAPSIGPRMAERLRPHGVLTVRDLLDEEPSALARALGLSYVTAETIRDWQQQARLVCVVPGLTGTGAQLFVGAGYRDVSAIATGEPEKVCADILRFAASPVGRRALRDGDPPNVERIKAWAEAARAVVAA